jgi:hypothetical protein
MLVGSALKLCQATARKLALTRTLATHTVLLNPTQVYQALWMS